MTDNVVELPNARRTVTVPAVLLMVSGGLGLLQSLLFGLIIASGLLEDAMPADQRTDPTAMKAALTLLKTIVVTGFPLFALVLGAGFALYNLKARWFVISACVLALIPCCTLYAWVITVPAAIWTFVILGRPEVKSAYGA